MLSSLYPEMVSWAKIMLTGKRKEKSTISKVNFFMVSPPAVKLFVLMISDKFMLTRADLFLEYSKWQIEWMMYQGYYLKWVRQ